MSSHHPACLCPTCSGLRASAHRCPAPIGPLPSPAALGPPPPEPQAQGVAHRDLKPDNVLSLTTCPRCGPKDARGPAGELLSHVTCPACAAVQREEWEAERGRERRQREAAAALQRATLLREQELAQLRARRAGGAA